MTMSRLFAIGLVTLILAGCQVAGPGTSRTLGEVEYAAAFAAARDVMGQYFSVDSVDRAAGVITSAAMPVESTPDLLLRRPAVRQLAVLQLVRNNSEVTANVSVAVQKQQSALYREPRMAEENYDRTPSRTPAELEAATTIDQNQTWVTQRYDRDTEAKILQDIYRALYGDGEQ